MKIATGLAQRCKSVTLFKDEKILRGMHRLASEFVIAPIFP